jgi:hypothetical protein
MCWHTSISPFSCTQTTFMNIIMWNLYTNVGSRHYCMLRVAELDFAPWALKFEVFVILCWVMTWMGFSHHRKLFTEKRVGMPVCPVRCDSWSSENQFILPVHESNNIANQWLKWIGSGARHHKAFCATFQCSCHKKDVYTRGCTPSARD